MLFNRQHYLAIGLAGLLAGCSFADDTLAPALAGVSPRAPSAVAPYEAMAEQPAATLSPEKLRADLTRLQADVTRRQQDLDAARQALTRGETGYDGLAAGIEQRPPGDARRSNAGDEAQAQLAQSREAFARLARLSSLTASDATLASYIVQASGNAATQPGVSDLDHGKYVQIEAEAKEAAASIDRILGEVGMEIAAQTERLSAARHGLAQLAAAAGPTRTAPARGTAAQAVRRPFVVIRFDGAAKPAFEPQLYDAVHKALARKPDAEFDVVAVTPAGGSAAAAKRNVASVVRALAAMGVPADRLTLSAKSDTASDAGAAVRVYVH